MGGWNTFLFAGAEPSEKYIFTFVWMVMGKEQFYLLCFALGKGSEGMSV